MTDSVRYDRALADVFGGATSDGYGHSPQDVYDQGRRDAFAEVEAWLKARRDACSVGYPEWETLDDALDDLREHSHTGTPLTEQVRGPHHEEQG